MLIRINQDDKLRFYLKLRIHSNDYRFIIVSRMR
nr:MAG TPA: hypothetical protein [Caudoviricetes sp.]